MSSHTNHRQKLVHAAALGVAKTASKATYMGTQYLTSDSDAHRKEQVLLLHKYCRLHVSLTFDVKKMIENIDHLFLHQKFLTITKLAGHLFTPPFYIKIKTCERVLDPFFYLKNRRKKMAS